MPRFYVNKNRQTNGDHEVHQVGACPTPAAQENRLDLGEHESCKGAVSRAKKDYPNWKINGCANCAPICHTS